MAKSTNPTQKLSTIKLTLLTVAASLLLLISNSAIWFNRNIFDTANFTEITSTALLSQASRDAMATGITDRVLQNRPAIKGIVDDRLIKLISSLLDTSLVHGSVDRSITFLHTTVTSKDPQPVTLDLSGTKATISRIMAVVNTQTDRSPEEQRVDLNDVPDEITLLDPTNLPNIYVMGTVLLWLGPLTMLLALGIFGYLIYRMRGDRAGKRNMLLIVTAALTLTGLLALLVGPLFRPPVLAQITAPNLRVVTANVYDAFASTFTDQTNTMFVLALLTGLAAAWVHFYPIIKSGLAARKKT